MFGQSNCEGNNSGAQPAPYNATVSNCLIFYKNNDSSATYNGTIPSLFYGTNNNYRTGSLTSSGSECALGYDYCNATGRQLLIVKLGYGGSLLVDDGSTVQANGIWQKNANSTRASGLVWYNISLYNFVLPALRLAQTAGYTPIVRAFLWTQGESDSTILACANAYESTWLTTFDAYREDIGQFYPSARRIVPIVTRIHNNFNAGTRPYLSTVRTALENCANLRGGFWLNSDAYALEADNIHWSKNGQITHGLDQSKILQQICL
jgi:hypothetical protein